MGMRPNPAFERTCRFMFSFRAGVASARRSTCTTRASLEPTTYGDPYVPGSNH